MGTTDIAPTLSDASRSLIGIDRLSAADILSLMHAARRNSNGPLPSFPGFAVCLLMLQPSLRTRLGFAEAAARLGGRAHVITSPRQTVDASAPESLWDTIRVASGMVDLLVVRAACSLAEFVGASKVPLLNAGDSHEHPTQALIDLFAMEQLRGPIGSLSVGICGDLSMRASRSLLKAFALIPPRRLRLMAPGNRFGDALMLVKSLGDRVEVKAGGTWEELDVLYMAGLPERSGTEVMDAHARAAFALNEANEHRLAANACVLNPMPVIDEIAPSLRQDARVCAYAQSDLGMAMRAAILTTMIKGQNGHAHA
jgi:aspartate carbamoyltransferase catalytic subunit